MKTAGIILFITSFLCTLLLAYGFRDFSLQLTAMFLISAAGLPLSTYLLIKNDSSHLMIFDEIENHLEPDDEYDVVDKFCIDCK